MLYFWIFIGIFFAIFEYNLVKNLEEFDGIWKDLSFSRITWVISFIINLIPIINLVLFVNFILYINNNDFIRLKENNSKITKLIN